MLLEELLYVILKLIKKLQKKFLQHFFEVILAKGFHKDALKVLETKNLILIDISGYKFDRDNQVKFLENFLYQEKNKKIFDLKKIKFVTKLKPNKKEIKNAEFAMNACKFVKSNAIVISNNFSTIGIGAGQPSRVDSCKIAVEKAKKFQIKN